MKTFSKLAVLSASACLLSLSAGQVQASQADEYSPEVKKVRVQEGNYLIARDLVKNASKLPENTIYGFVHEPNFLKAGTYRTRIRILYPDDSTEETRKAKVHVKSASDAQRYQPVVTGRTIAFGKAFKSKRLVTNKSSCRRRPATALRRFLTSKKLVLTGPGSRSLTRTRARKRAPGLR